jgi:BlaI family transcriptional regulator, penicillinase repressor
MTRPRTEGLTPREAQIMEALWRLGTATAEQIREAMPDAPHDSTIRTLLRVLETKGQVEHEVRGKAFVYRAAVEQARIQSTALRHVIARFFGGSAENLVLRLIEDERLNAEQLDAIRRAAPAPGRATSGRRKNGAKR